jgi:AraC-like DNA-binding protein
MGTGLGDGAWLSRRYVREGASIRDLAAELGCSTHSVTQSLIRHGIPRRPVGSPKGVPSRDAGQQAAYQQLRDRDFLVRRYVEDRMTIQQIADLAGCSVARVRRALGDHGIPIRWVGRRAPVQVDKGWLTRRYTTDLASIREIAAELGCSLNCVLDLLIEYGIPRRPVGTPKGLPARDTQLARLRKIPTRRMHQILVDADTEADAAAALGVSHAVLVQVADDAGIDRESVTRERTTRKRVAGWPLLLRDRDRLVAALDASPSVSALARRAGCSPTLVRTAAAHHKIRITRRPTGRPAPRWTGQPSGAPTPAAAPALGRATGQLQDSNTERTRTAAARTVDAARVILAVGDCPDQHRAVLQARVDHPQASLAELGTIFGATKDAYAAMLRRALATHRSTPPLPTVKAVRPSTPVLHRPGV